MGNHEEQRQVDEGQPKGSNDKSPWEKLAIGLRSVRLLKNPVRLRELRDNAIKMKADFQEEIVSLETRLTHEADPLDKLADTKEIETKQDRIKTIDKGLAGIQARATKLTEGDDE